MDNNFRGKRAELGVYDDALIHGDDEVEETEKFISTFEEGNKGAVSCYAYPVKNYKIKKEQ